MTVRTYLVLILAMTTSFVIASAFAYWVFDDTRTAVPIAVPLAVFAMLLIFGQHVVKESSPFATNEALTKRDAAKTRVVVENIHSSCWGLMLFFVAAGVLNVVASVVMTNAVVVLSIFAGTAFVALGSLPWLVSKHFEILRFGARLASLKREDEQREKLLKGMRGNGGTTT